MGTVKYPILDRDVRIKMLGCCVDDRQRGLVLLLLNTGMHPSVFSSPRKAKERPRPPPKIMRDGKTSYLQWSRPKSNKTLRSLPIAKEDLRLIKIFLDAPRQSNKHHDQVLQRIGERAGYDGVSCLTLRHTYCIWLLRPREEGGAGMTIYQVPHWMGCTLEVVARNYAIMSGEQLLEITDSDDAD